MEPLKLTTQQFERFSDFIYRQSGIRINANKITLLSHRIRRRLRSLNLDSFDDYYKLLTSRTGEDELKFFLDAITTNETYFFRSPEHFDWFQKTYLKQLNLAERAGERKPKLKIWSAACSSGEEAYSAAICLADSGLRTKSWDIEIVGTDISEAVLDVARAGIYKQRATENLTDRQRQRWFRPGPKLSQADQQDWALRDEIKERVQFQYHNLMEPINKTFDCIFIRNVMIYFDKESKTKVVEHLINSLAPGGYLIVGPTEGIFHMLGECEKVESFLYRKKS